MGLIINSVKSIMYKLPRMSPAIHDNEKRVMSSSMQVNVVFEWILDVNSTLKNWVLLTKPTFVKQTLIIKLAALQESDIYEKNLTFNLPSTCSFRTIIWAKSIKLTLGDFG